MIFCRLSSCGSLVPVDPPGNSLEPVTKKRFNSNTRPRDLFLTDCLDRLTQEKSFPNTGDACWRSNIEIDVEICRHCTIRWNSPLPGRAGVCRRTGSRTSTDMRYQEGPTAQAEVVIEAPAARVWELVTDINLPAQFSSEFRGATWVDEGP